ncbi:hypothetical protein JKP88DRAFT_330034 [Tribonema minus]|uniref:peptidylprolyl isomerase n=1 Tax=Tribonema minus TaxID=303371 RepID=A0A836CBL2_9STRA|nr:hypothetical protein JKP88DRAFT_330034 [Tribonema minus]
MLAHTVTSHQDPPKPIERVVAVGDEVMCFMGRGIVEEIRRDGVHVVQAKGWSLANETRARYYLQKAAVKWAPPKAAFEMNKLERMEAAREAKARAVQLFKEGDMFNAMARFNTSIAYLRYINEGETNNRERAESLELMIQCNNNMATCHLRLEKYAEAVVFAHTAQQLCEALESNSEGRVMAELKRRGVSEDLVFRTWCRKALFLKGKAHHLKGEHADAVASLQGALKRAVQQKEAADIRKLLDASKAALAQQKQREKKMWAGAFKKNSEEAATTKECAAAAAAAAPAAVAPRHGSPDAKSPSAAAAPAVAARGRARVAQPHMNGGSSGGAAAATPAAARTLSPLTRKLAEIEARNRARVAAEEAALNDAEGEDEGDDHEEEEGLEGEGEGGVVTGRGTAAAAAAGGSWKGVLAASALVVAVTAAVLARRKQ